MKSYLQKNGYIYHEFADKAEFFEKAAHELASEKVIGLFHGRMRSEERRVGKECTG